MKVVHVDESNLRGTARASARIHEGLLEAGVDSVLFTRRDDTGDEGVRSHEGKLTRAASLVKPHLDSVPLALYDPTGEFSPNWVPGRLAKRVNAQSPDLVQFHWMGRGFLPIRDVRKIEAPIAWRFPDMWPLTGGCHYSLGCEKFGDSCGACPVLESTSEWDLTRLQMRRKRRHFGRADITPIATTEWLRTQAERSSVFGDREVHKIPNPVDTQRYRPVDRGLAREILDLPRDGTVLLFGAVNPTKNPYKGYDVLLEALSAFERRTDTEDVCIAVFGTDELPEFDVDLRTETFGWLYDDTSLRLLYSAADGFLMPSIAEAFGMTVIEALSCGTPVVAFEETGPSDIVAHEETGYLATFESSSDFSNGIEWVCEADSDAVGERTRTAAVERFDTDVVVDAYRTLYDDIYESH